MKKGLLLTSVTALVLLTSCGTKAATLPEKYGTDLPEKYKDFFDYIYGEDGYTFKEEYFSEENLEKAWNLTFSDKNGNEHTVPLWTRNYKNQKDFFQSKKVMDTYNVYNAYITSVCYAAEQDINDRILSKYIDFEDVGNIIWYEGEGFKLYSSIYRVSDIYYEQFYNEIENGIDENKLPKLSESDGSSVGSDKMYYWLFNLRINDEARKDELLEKAEAIFADYVEYVGTPQNYSFSVSLKVEEEKLEKLLEKQLVLGEEFDLEAKKAELGKEHYLFSRAVEDALFEE